MRKSFLKTVVATAVVGATMALSSVAAWAETAMFKITDNVSNGDILTGNLEIDNITYHFKEKNSKYVVGSKTIDGETFSAGINTGGKTSSSTACCYFSFSLSESTDIKVYYAAAEGSKTVKIGLSKSITDNADNFIDNVEVASSNTGASKTFTVENVSTKTNYYICLNNGKATIYGIKLTPHSDPAANTFDIDFRTKATTATTNGTYYYTSDGTQSTSAPESYAVSVAGVQYHSSGSVYGLYGDSPVITIPNVKGPAKISIQSADYAGAFTFVSDKSDGKFLVPIGSDYAENNVLYTIGSKGAYKSIYYTGTESATITISASGLQANDGAIGTSGQAYIPAIKVESVTAPTALAATSPFSIDSFYTNSTNVYVIGKIARADAESVDSVGFVNLFGTNKTVTATGVVKTIKDGETTVKEENEGYYYIALKITGADSGKVFAVLPEAVSGTTTTTAAAGTYTVA